MGAAGSIRMSCVGVNIDSCIDVRGPFALVLVGCCGWLLLRTEQQRGGGVSAASRLDRCASLMCACPSHAPMDDHPSATRHTDRGAVGPLPASIQPACGALVDAVTATISSGAARGSNNEWIRVQSSSSPAAHHQTHTDTGMRTNGQTDRRTVSAFLGGSDPPPSCTIMLHHRRGVMCSLQPSVA